MSDLLKVETSMRENVSATIGPVSSRDRPGECDGGLGYPLGRFRNDACVAWQPVFGSQGRDDLDRPMACLNP